MKKKRTLFTLLALLILPLCLFAQDNKEEKAKELYSLGKIYKEHGLTDFAAKEFQKAYDIVLKDQQEKKLAAKEVKKQEVVKDRYVIGPNDILNINVWENPDLTGNVKIRPDGMISFPLIDEFKVSGMTIDGVDKFLTERLKEFIRYPDVSVSLESIGGRKVIILGEIRSPGVVQLADAHTLLEAIALAGGATKNAVLRSVLVIKGGLENPTPQRVNLARYLKKPNTLDNIILEARDIVYIPETFLSDLSYTMSQILAPLQQGRIAHGDAGFYEDLIK